MILDISNSEFKNLLDDEKMFLPIRWDGYDFLQTLNELFDYYIKRLELLPNDGHHICVDTKVVKRACGCLSKAVSHYLNGFPSRAYTSFERSMNIFMDRPLRIYQKSVTEQFEDKRKYRGNDDSLKLFRVTSVSDNKPYGRERVFHTPYNLRSKVSTSRYAENEQPT